MKKKQTTFVTSVYLLAHLFYTQVEGRPCVPQSCSTCQADGSGNIIRVFCSGTDIHLIPNTVKDLTLVDASSRTMLGFLKDDLFSGKTSLVNVTIMNYGLSFMWGSPLHGNGNLRKLNLTANQISAFDHNNLVGAFRMEVLDLSRNIISKIPNYSFSNISSLREMIIASNNLSEILKFSFHGLFNLEILNLKLNRISVIHPEAFKTNAKLRCINLDSNRILHVDFMIIDGLINLSTFLLGNNSIGTISQINKKQHNITRLDLSRNHLASLPVGFLENISSSSLSLDLSYNKIRLLSVTDLTDNIFQSLNLQYNGLDEIHDGVVTDCNIKHVFLGNNNLKTLPESLNSCLKNTDTIDLSGNPWNCSCGLLWIIEFLNTHQTSIAKPIPACRNPVFLFETPLNSTQSFLQRNCSEVTTVQQSEPTVDVTGSPGNINKIIISVLSIVIGILLLVGIVLLLYIKKVLCNVSKVSSETVQNN